jgi:hypothetical protein
LRADKRQREVNIRAHGSRTHVLREMTIIHDHVEVCDTVWDRTGRKDLVMEGASNIEIGTFRSDTNGVGDSSCFGTILCKVSPVVAQGSENVFLEGERGIARLYIELYFYWD